MIKTVDWPHCQPPRWSLTTHASKRVEVYTERSRQNWLMFLGGVVLPQTVKKVAGVHAQGAGATTAA